MKRRMLQPLLLLFLYGCTPAQQQHDHHHLPAATMEQVLLDMQLAEVYSAMAHPDSITVNVKDMDSLACFYTEILGHYGITQEAFVSSMKWYETHPEELDRIYTRISERLTVMSGKEKE